MAEERTVGCEEVVKEPRRERYWSELAIEEKIERTRIQLKTFQSLVRRLDPKGQG